MKPVLFPTLVLASLAFAGTASAAEKCDVPMDQWKPREDLQSKLEADGWQVRSIKTEDGCYEAYAIDAKGNKVEAYFNPSTFEQVGAGDDDAG